MSCCVHGGMYAVFFTFLKYPFKKINLKHALSTREGHTAARVIVKGVVFQDFSHNIVDGIFLSADLPCVTRTINRTFAAKLARFQMIRAFFFAFVTTRTLVFEKHHLRLRRLAFGIVTPRAAQITALEEDGCTYPGTVDVGIAFYIEYGRPHHISPRMLGSCNNIVLNCLVQLEEIIRKARNAHTQVLVFIGGLLGAHQIVL